MKHHRATRIALMSSLVAALSAPVLAQQPTATINESVSSTAAAPRPDAPPPGPRAHGPDGQRGPGGMHHGPRGAHMLHGVQLTDAQKTQVSALREAVAPEMREAMMAAGKARKELRELVNATNFDEARAQQLANDAAAAQAKAAVLRAKTEHQVLALLTPEQRTSLEERRKQAAARAQERREARAERGERGERGGERRTRAPSEPAAVPSTAPTAPAPAAAPAAPR